MKFFFLPETNDMLLEEGEIITYVDFEHRLRINPIALSTILLAKVVACSLSLQDSSWHVQALVSSIKQSLKALCALK